MLMKSYYNCFPLVTKLSLFLDNNWTTTISVEEKVLQLSEVLSVPPPPPQDYMNEFIIRKLNLFVVVDFIVRKPVP